MSAPYQTMQCLGCDYFLDGVPSKACPECGRPFDPSDVSSFRRLLSDPVVLHAAPTVAEAHALQATLEECGIYAVVEPVSRGIIGIFEVKGGLICVDRTSRERAAEIVADALSRGGGPGWQCSACGERVDAGFDICCNCQADRPRR